MNSWFADRVTWIGCSNGTAPAAGIDLEPDGVYYDLENITIRDCFAVNNTGHGLQSYLVSGEAHSVRKDTCFLCTYAFLTKLMIC